MLKSGIRKQVGLVGLFLIVLLTLGFGCGGGGGGGGSDGGDGGNGSNTSPPAIDISGVWDVLGYTNDESGTDIAFLSMDADGTVTGSVMTADISGSLRGHELSITIQDSSVVYTVSGIVSAAGVKLTGTFDSNDDNGHFIAKKRVTGTAERFPENFFADKIWVKGSYAYIADGIGLKIVNVSDPDNPTLTGSCETMGISSMVRVQGNYGYILEESTGLKIIDISNPANPRVVGAFPAARYASGLCVQGTYAYLLDDWQGLYIIDISDPTRPVETGHFNTENWSYSLSVRGNYAYVGFWMSGRGGTQIINISDPANPTGLGQTGYFGQVMVVNDTHAFIGGSPIEILDISDPTNPADVEVVGHIPGVLSEDMWLTGDLLLVASGDSGITVIDVSSPEKPVVQGSFPTQEPARGIWGDAENVYAACGTGGLEIINLPELNNTGMIGAIEGNVFDDYEKIVVNNSVAFVAEMYTNPQIFVIDVTDPTAPEQLGTLDPNGWGDVADLFALNDTLYTLEESEFGSSDPGLLQIWDVSDPASPVAKGSQDIFTPGYLHVQGSYAYVTGEIDELSGLHIIDVSSPDTPAKVGAFLCDGYRLRVGVNGDYAYLAGGTPALKVINIADAASPVQVAFLDPGGVIDEFHVSGNYLYMTVEFEVENELDDTTTAAYALKVVDISTPSAPAILGSYSCEAPQHLFADGTWAYLTLLDDENQVRIIDFSDPGNPNHVTSFKPFSDGVEYRLTDLFVDGDYAYIILNDLSKGDLQIYNLDGLRSSIEKGRYATEQAYFPDRIEITGNHAYVQSDYHGLGIIQVSNLSNMELLGTYPVGIAENITSHYPGSRASEFALAGDHVLVADNYDSLRIIDSINKSDLEFLISLYFGNLIQDLKVQGSHAFVLTDNTLVPVDLTNIQSPSMLATVDIDFFSSTLSIEDDYAYVAGSGGELQILDIHTPDSIIKLGYLDDSSSFDDIDIGNGFAYIAAGHDGLAIVDVSDLNNPELVTKFDIGNAKRVVHSVDRVYVGGGAEDGVTVLDVSNPANPVPIDFFNTPGTAGDFYIKDGYVYIADGVGGLRVCFP